MKPDITDVIMNMVMVGLCYFTVGKHLEPPKRTQKCYCFAGEIFYSLREISKKLKIGIGTAQKRAKNGKYPIIKFNGLARIPAWGLATIGANRQRKVDVWLMMEHREFNCDFPGYFNLTYSSLEQDNTEQIKQFAFCDEELLLKLNSCERAFTVYKEILEVGEIKKMLGLKAYTGVLAEVLLHKKMIAVASRERDSIHWAFDGLTRTGTAKFDETLWESVSKMALAGNWIDAVMELDKNGAV